jgi:hypothetical protein
MVRPLLLQLAFLLELVAVSVVLLVAVIAFWARYMAPKSPRRLGPP